jgi:hypothetical protein
MTSRQAGHFFFEPKDYDVVNQATHDHKEEIKVGYNLRRKIVLMTIWALSPLLLWLNPTAFGLCLPARSLPEFARHVGYLWLAIGLGGLVFRTVQLFVIKDVMTGLVWAISSCTIALRHCCSPTASSTAAGTAKTQSNRITEISIRSCVLSLPLMGRAGVGGDGGLISPSIAIKTRPPAQ